MNTSLRVLVLDQGYQPHRVVSWQRAIGLLFRNIAEVVEEYDEEIRSITLAIRAPSVIRLVHKISISRGIKFSRMNVLARDHFRCQYCGKQFPLKQLNFDHVIPKSRGGKTTWDNIVTSCIACNSIKGDRIPQEAGMRLRKKPRRPSSLPFILFRINSTSRIVPDSWNNYLLF